MPLVWLPVDSAAAAASVREHVTHPRRPAAASCLQVHRHPLQVVCRTLTGLATGTGHVAAAKLAIAAAGDVALLVAVPVVQLVAVESVQLAAVESQ